MGRRGYPPEFRRKVLDLVQAGRPIAEVAKALGISAQSIYTWRRQDRIVKGLLPGLSSPEKEEFAAARRRIAQLETEAAVTHRAAELLKEAAPFRRFAAIAVAIAFRSNGGSTVTDSKATTRDEAGQQGGTRGGRGAARGQPDRRGQGRRW